MVVTFLHELFSLLSIFQLGCYELYLKAVTVFHSVQWSATDAHLHNSSLKLRYAIICGIEMGTFQDLLQTSSISEWN